MGSSVEQVSYCIRSVRKAKYVEMPVGIMRVVRLGANTSRSTLGPERIGSTSIGDMVT